MDDYRILPAGDESLIVEFGNEISEELNAKVKNLCNRMNPYRRRGILDIVPTYRSVMVTYDERKISYHRLVRMIAHCMKRQMGQTEKKKVIEIPVCYGSVFGPDLANVSSYTGLSEEEIIKRHCSREYLIYMLGFLPGFPYLGGMDEALAVPRLQEPRVKIDAGSVGIAGKQTGIYPMDSPGGWQLIGRTPIKVYDPDRKQPVLFEAGDYIRFYPVSEKEFYEIRDKHQNVL